MCACVCVWTAAQVGRAPAGGRGWAAQTRLGTDSKVLRVSSSRKTKSKGHSGAYFCWPVKHMPSTCFF